MPIKSFALAALLAALPASAADQVPSGEEALQFLAEEARVVSASARPETARHAPSTTYVLTGEDIRSSGAQTLWDALRLAPGVDVSTVRSSQGAVSIRGLNKVSNNRTLILLDGRTLLNGYFDTLTWEAVPVSLDEIERIEIVEGPVSALYGANAVSGVINIITKNPEQMKGTRVRYAYGEHNTSMATVLHGDVSEDRATKITGGYDTNSAFADQHRKANESAHVAGLQRWTLSEDSEVSVSGGIRKHNAQTSGGPDFSRDEGHTGFARGDARWDKLNARVFWNSGRSVDQNSPTLGNPRLDYDIYDAVIQQGVSLGDRDDLTVGAEYRRNSARTAIIGGDVSEDLPSLFAENQWRAAEKLTLVASGRLDRHPFTHWVFSPRGSILYDLTETQSLRFTAATSFRNPTLLENDINLAVNTAQGNFTLVGANIRPERMTSFEVAHHLTLGRLRTTVTVFDYLLQNQIAGNQMVTAAGPPAQITINVVNRGATRAVGGEFGFEALLERRATLFGNYSYQSLEDDDAGVQHTEVSAPKHKANGGLRWRDGGFTATIWETWVDHTLWVQSGSNLTAVPAYGMLNLFAGYKFSKGRLDGVELSVSAWNAANYHHREMAPFLSAASTGQGADLIDSRWMGSVAYHF